MAARIGWIIVGAAAVIGAQLCASVLLPRQRPVVCEEWFT